MLNLTVTYVSVIIILQAEVNFLGQLHHGNLVKLIGYCSEDDQRLLVYEFMPRGSLENHLFRSELILMLFACCVCLRGWRIRFRVKEFSVYSRKYIIYFTTEFFIWLVTFCQVLAWDFCLVCFSSSLVWSEEFSLDFSHIITYLLTLQVTVL